MKNRIGMFTAMAVVLAVGGCNVVLGLDDYQAPPDGVGCTSGSQVECIYSGPGGTEGVGLCKAGVQTCKADGSGYGPCEGEVVPVAEDCSTQYDDDCDGTVNEAEACACTPGTQLDCYSGAAGTEGVGLCKKGTQTCKNDGTGYDVCMNEVLPTVENCATAEDEDCDGLTFDDTVDKCACKPGDSVKCYTGPTGTQDVGACTSGMWTCNADGLGYGACMGEKGPAPTDDCKVFGDEDCSGSGCSDHIFSAAYGDVANQEVNYLATDSAGNFIVVGGFYGSMKIGVDTLVENAAGDIFIAKFDPEGNPIWARKYGAAGFQTATGVATDGQGNVYVVGWFGGTIDFGVGGSLVSDGSTDSFIAKLDAAGNPVWASKYQGATNTIGDFFWAVAVDSQGRAAVTGNYNDGQDGILIVRYSAGGTKDWEKVIASTVGQAGAAIATDLADNIYVTGRFDGTVSLGTVMTSLNGTDAFLTKLDPVGNFSWAKTIGGGGKQTGRGVAVDSAANVIVTGTNDGTANFGAGNVTGLGAFVAKYNTAAVYINSKQLGGGSTQIANRVAVDFSDNIILAGEFLGFIDFGGGALNTTGDKDMFLAKFDSDLGHLWSKSFGAGMMEVQFAYGLDTGPTGRIYLTGQGSGLVGFGGVTAVVGGGGTELYVAGFEP